VFDVYEASREMLLDILAVVIILSPISSVRGVYIRPHFCRAFLHKGPSKLASKDCWIVASKREVVVCWGGGR